MEFLPLQAVAAAISLIPSLLSLRIQLINSRFWTSGFRLLEARRGGEGGQPKALHSPAPGFGQPKALHSTVAPGGGQPKAVQAASRDSEHPKALQVCANEGDTEGTSQVIPVLKVAIYRQ